MSLSPQKSREIVFQLLFSQSYSKTDDDLASELLAKELKVTKKNIRESFEKTNQIQKKLVEIDQSIASASESYQFERIQSVEKTILRLCVYELLFCADIPPKVVIAEGIRLARKFSTPESAHFVNALLDHIYQLREGRQIQSDTLKTAVNEMIQSEDRARAAAGETDGTPSPKTHST